MTDALTFGGVPHTDDERTRWRLARLCRLWSEAVGVEIHPHRSPSPSALASAFERNRVQLAWVSPTLFLLSAAFANARPLLSTVRGGQAEYHAVLFAAADSSLRDVEDMWGSTVAWVAPTSASGYVVPRLALAARGLDPRLLFAKETFADTHGAVARAVADGRADVGATFAAFEGGDASGRLLHAGFDEADGIEARILLASGPIPADVIVASTEIAPELRRRLATTLDALTSNEAASDLCEALFGAHGYRAYDPRALEPLRRTVAHAGTLGLCEGPARPRLGA